MRRRDFLATGAALLAGSAIEPLAKGQSGDTSSTASRQWIEIRTYHFASADKQKAYQEFLTGAAVAAFARAGSKTVGLFRELAADNPKLKLAQDSTDLWLILGHDSPEAFADFESRLASDADYQSAGKGILSAGKTDPAFARYDAELLIAFEKFPRIQPRELKESRVLEMRTYESPNQERAASKVAMFNRAEIPIFQRVGMPGVFWGSAVAGTDLPHLTYMVWHESIEQAPKDWKAFGADAEWNQLKNEEQYKDNVSKIVNRFLRPIAGSQI
jgi:hypothetical protein